MHKTNELSVSGEGHWAAADGGGGRCFIVYSTHVNYNLYKKEVKAK